MPNITLFLQLTLSQLIPAFIGWQIFKSFSPRNKLFFFEKLALAYGLGFGCISLWMLYLSILKIHFNLFIITLPPILLFVVINYFYRAKSSESREEARHNNRALGLAGRLLLIFIIGNIILVFFRTMIIEKDTWDSWANWAFKARIFYYHKLIPLDLFQQLKTVYGCWDYPLHVPLMETWSFLWLGSWNDQLPRVIFPVFYSVICVTIFYFLRRYTSLKTSLIALFFITTLESLKYWTIGTIAEPVLLFYYLASFLLLYRWMEEQDTKLLIFSAIFSGLAGWSKNEGLALFASNIFVLIAFLTYEKRGARKAVASISIYSLAALLIILPWTVFKLSAGLENDCINIKNLTITHIFSNLKRIGDTGRIFAFHFLDFKKWNLLWVLFFPVLAYTAYKKRIKRTGYILLSMAFQSVVCIFIYIIWPWEPKRYMIEVLPRLVLAPAILAILYCFLSLFPEETKQKGPHL